MDCIISVNLPAAITMANTKITIVWLILMGLSLLMLLVAEAAIEGQVFSVLLLGSAWFKGQLIIDYFMGLRQVVVLWRMIVSIWLMLVISTIVLVYLLAS